MCLDNYFKSVMADTAFTRHEILGLVLRLTLVSAVTFVSIKWIMNQVDPTNKGKKKARQAAEEKLKRYELLLFIKMIMLTFGSVDYQKQRVVLQSQYRALQIMK